jgi:hypothetical protein
MSAMASISKPPRGGSQFTERSTSALLTTTLVGSFAAMSLLGCAKPIEENSSDASVDAGSGSEAGPNADAILPQCPARTPVDPYTGEYADDALPEGSCNANDAPLCQISARERCHCALPSPAAVGGYHHYRCECRDGSWTCVIELQGGSFCLCNEPDGAVADAEVPADAADD